MVHIRDEGVFDAPLEKIWKYIGDDTPGLHKHRAIPSTKVLSEEGNVVVQEMQMLNSDGKGTHWETWRLMTLPQYGRGAVTSSSLRPVPPFQSRAMPQHVRERRLPPCGDSTV